MDQKTWKERAFAGHAEQRRMSDAADYTDEWFCEDEKGNSMRCFYVCMAGGSAWPCGTVIISSAWSRMHQDPLATKQRWYCNTCHAKYKTSFGMVLEFIIQRRSYFLRIPFPPKGWSDIKKMAVERKYKAKTPEELLLLLPDVHPTTNEWMNATAEYGVYRFDPKAFEQVPALVWDQLYTLMLGILGA